MHGSTVTFVFEHRTTLVVALITCSEDALEVEKDKAMSFVDAVLSITVHSFGGRYVFLRAYVPHRLGAT